jgi:hypothetical protein
MATYTKTVGASGADFSSFDAWQSNRLGGRSGDSALAPGDVEELVYLDGTYTGTSAIGLSTSWPAGVTIVFKAQNSHLNDWSVTTQGARIDAPSGWDAISFSGTYAGIAVEIQDLIAVGHASTVGRGCFEMNDASGLTVEFTNSMLKGTTADASGFRVLGGSTNCPIEMVNTVVVTDHATEKAIHLNWSNGMVSPLTATGGYIQSIYAGKGTGQNSALVLNGTLMREAASPDGSSRTATDCICPDGWTSWTTTNCSTGAFVTGTPASGEVGFTNMATHDYSLVDHANNLAIDYAVNATMPATDILGETRDADPDCGPFEVVTVGSAPDAPTDFVVDTVTHNSIAFSWTDVATDEDNYEVEYKLSSAGSWDSWDAALAPDTETDTITGLSAETDYDIRVRAVNDDGESAWLTESNITTDAAPASTGRGVRRGLGLGLGLGLTKRRGGGGGSSASVTYLWSDPATWGGTVPTGGDVTIEPGQLVILDTDTAELDSLTIEGTLRAQQGADISITSDLIMVDGGVLEIGTSATPFTGTCTIELTGATPSHSTDGEDGSKLNNGLTRAIMVENGGRIDMHGTAPTVTVTRIGAHIDVSVEDNSITLSEPVTWAAGDQFILSKTDFYRVGNTELLTVASNVVNSTTVPVVENIATDRWGVLQYPIDASPGVSLTQDTFTPPHADTPLVLDERATVAHLTRNIKIQGKNDTTWSTDGIGGHTMVDADNTCTYRLENVELLRMGQKHSKGRYPIHFHMLSWVDNLNPDPELRGTWLGEAPAERFYAKGCTIRESMNRAVVIHGTHGVLVEKVIAFDIKGHAFFEEDGPEEDNIIQDCVAMKVRDPGSGLRIKKHDQFASGFWLVNPNNKIRRNIASDCEGFGFWNSFADDPFGLSRDVDVEPRFIVIDEFDDNIGHSCKLSGIKTEGDVTNEAGDTGFNRYLERYTGGQVHIFFANRNQCWKNSASGYQNRVMSARYVNWTMADNDGDGWGSADFFGSSLGRAKNQGALQFEQSLNNATAKVSEFHVGVASYHFEMDFEYTTFIGYTLHPPDGETWVNGQMVQGGGAMGLGDLYTDSAFYQLGRSPGWKLINSDAGLLPRSPAFDTHPVDGWGSGGTKYRRWTLGFIHDPYGYWATAGHWIVPDRDLYTYGLTTTPVTGQTTHVSFEGHAYGINRIELDYDSSLGSGGSTRDRTIWHRLDTSNASIDDHEIGDGDDSIFFNGFRSFMANREGRFLLELPDTNLALVDHVRINTWFAHTLEEWFLIGVPWDGARTPSRVSVDTDSTLSSTPARSIALTGTSIADVLADTTGATGWRDTSNNRIWVRFRGTSAGSFDATAPVTDENNEALAYRRYLQIQA